MAYVWINPVVNAMYGAAKLREALRGLGFEVLDCTADHAAQVRAHYARAVAQRGGRTVVDMRCPAAAARFRALAGDSAYTFPDIEPILVHCAREVCARVPEAQECLVITPCESLAACGRHCRVPRAQFLTWKAFLARPDVDSSKLPPARRLADSPVPPGFFAPLSCAVHSLSGAQAIQSYASKRHANPPALLELLDCPGGCHHGDGV